MPEQPVKVVVVGCGGMGRYWVRLAADSEAVELVGLVDLDRARALKVAEEYKLPASLVYDTLGEAIRSTGAQAVFDVTVPAAHAAVTLEALSLGCHVLGEKPMSDNLADARRMIDAASKAGKLYAVTQTRRPLPQMMSVARFLASGALGSLTEIHSDFYIAAHFGGFRAEMAHPLVVDMAIHTFDNARQLVNADPVSVYCHGWNPPQSWTRGDISACAIFEMRGPQGEPIVYTYRGSWCNEGMQTSWEAQWRCVGTRGTLLWDGGMDVQAERVKDEREHGVHRELEEVHVPMLELDRTGHDYLIHDFVDAIHSNGSRKPMCCCEDNIKSLAMVLAAVQSADTGRRVEVEW